MHSRCFGRATFRSWGSGSPFRSSPSPDPGGSANAPFEEIFHPIAERLLARCDAVLRTGGPSKGADLMVETARKHGLAVYHDLREVPGCRDASPPSS